MEVTWDDSPGASIMSVVNPMFTEAQSLCRPWQCHSAGNLHLSKTCQSPSESLNPIGIPHFMMCFKHYGPLPDQKVNHKGDMP